MIGPVRVGERLVGPGEPCLVVAEAGVNHNGDLDTALRLIDAAVAAGADAVKFQSFIPEDLVTASAGKAAYQERFTGKGDQLAMLRALALSGEEHARLKRHCDAASIEYLCTPYDLRSTDLIHAIGVSAFKVASTDTTNVPFLRYLAAKGRPVILSTGMCGLAEVELAVETLEHAGTRKAEVILLQCTAEYPAPVTEINLRAMQTMERAFLCPTGFSDHTMGIDASTWAVAVGACLVEKHFTLSRDMEGPDHRASVEPEELALLVRRVREVEAALGNGRKSVMPCEAGNREKMRKSLVVLRDLAAGERISPADLACKRPGTGLPPHLYDRVVGRTLARDVTADSLLTMDAVLWED